jgi:hypothetical protein
MPRSDDELRAENRRLKEQLRQRDYKFGEAARNLAQHIEADPVRLAQIRRERRNQREAGDE